VITSTVKIIRSELEVLNKGVKAFGRIDPAANPEGLDLQDVLGNIKEHAPANTFQLLHHTAGNQRQDKYKSHDGHSPRIVRLVSILSLGRAQTTANSFARSLSLYLYASGVPRRALTLLNNLGITDSYQSVRRAVTAIKDGSSPSKDRPSKMLLTNSKGCYCPVKE
jgi:hypothetical protein